MDFCNDYSKFFVRPGMNSINQARGYLSGLLGTTKDKNIERMVEGLNEGNYQSYEHFIGSSPWKHEPIIQQVAQDASAMMGEQEDVGFFIDETSFLKKGKGSVGVQRQWSGRVGKKENCQVAVFGCLGNSSHLALTGFKLYLPESWAEDKNRCDKAKIPESQQVYRPKWQQGLELVEEALSNQVDFGWVGADALYGATSGFVNGVEDMGLKFIGDVRSNTKVWTSRPEVSPIPSLEEQRKKRGRKQSSPHMTAEEKKKSLRVSALVAEEFTQSSRHVVYRTGTKGKLNARAYRKEVWTWDEQENEPRRRFLIVCRDRGGKYKYALTNISDEEPLDKIVGKMMQRFWIEQAFKEAKSYLGMADYQVRGWLGWHHHMTLICMALLFMQKIKRSERETMPLLSGRDIIELLEEFLPRKVRDKASVIEQIKTRHKQRQLDIDRRRDHFQNDEI